MTFGPLRSKCSAVLDVLYLTQLSTTRQYNEHPARNNGNVRSPERATLKHDYVLRTTRRRISSQYKRAFSFLTKALGIQ